jgi:hypothetical protein
MQVYGTLGAVLLGLSAIPFVRFAILVAMGQGYGHVQSLVIGAVLAFLGGQMFIMGMLATAISWNRRMMEDVLFRLKSEPQAPGRERPRLRLVRTGTDGLDNMNRERNGHRTHRAA